MRRTNFVLFRDEHGQPVRCTVLTVGSGTPHVVLAALQHGNEVLGLEGGLQALRTIERSRVHGTVTLLTCLNPIGFQEGTRNFLQRSFDLAGAQTNLNRLYPGHANGTLAERIVYATDQYIASLAPDYIIDLHSYAVQSVPHLILDPVEPAMRQRLMAWALASGLPYYHEFAADNYAAQALTNCLSGVWCARGVPAVTLELGPQTGWGLAERVNAGSAVLQSLRALGLTDIAPELDERTQAMARQLVGGQWQRLEVENHTPGVGYVRHLVPIDAHVRQGQRVAEIVQLDGRIAGRILAPATGVLFIWHDDPRAYPGTKLGILLQPLVH